MHIVGFMYVDVLQLRYHRRIVWLSRNERENMIYGDEEWAREQTVTAAQAKREIEKHSLSFEDFVKECGKRASYKGSTVLNWLGY